MTIAYKKWLFANKQLRSKNDGRMVIGIDGKILAKMMGFQVACTLMFGGVLALCTRAKKHEIFGACAAYVAILVVFVGQSAD
ncbi:hypothetical protein SLS64_006759 [Diaporthe eres]